MAQFKSLNDAFKAISKQVDRTKRQALNKALSETKKEYVANAKEELGIPAKRIKGRARITKPGGKRANNGTLSIGIRVLLAAHDFVTKKFRVNTPIGRRFGAQYKVKGQVKDLPANSFITNVSTRESTKKLVLQRKGEARYPVTTTLVNELAKNAEEQRPSLVDFLKDHFKVYFEDFLKKNRK